MMDEYLKPEFAFKDFTLFSGDSRFDHFDVRKFYKCLIKIYDPLRRDYPLRRFKYDNKSYYDRLPRICRYYISEYKFYMLEFKWDDFYKLKYDENLITIDYCNKMLEYYPGHQKTLKILNELKKNNPEYFV